MCHHFIQKKKLEQKTNIVLFSYVSDFFMISDSNNSNNNTTTSSSTLYVSGSANRSASPNSTISTLTLLPTAPRLTTDSFNLNNSTKTELGDREKN
jgi:hypothetical protein